MLGGLFMNFDQILEKILEGNYQHTYTKLPSGILVSTDALKVDGIRINVSWRQLKIISSLFSARPMTEAVVNELIENAVVRIDPVIMPISSSWESTVRHSHEIDKLIGSHEGLVDNAGKFWISLDKYPWFANYGLFCSGNVWKGIKTYGPKHSIQPVSTKHNEDHVDYSQTCRFMSDK
jgi:hypothetical protein